MQIRFGTDHRAMYPSELGLRDVNQLSCQLPQCSEARSGSPIAGWLARCSKCLDFSTATVLPLSCVPSSSSSSSPPPPGRGASVFEGLLEASRRGTETTFQTPAFPFGEGLAPAPSNGPGRGGRGVGASR
eukprot:4380803-Pyramimonas_sp.AAC.1